MSYLAVIPARSGSQRIPKKNIYPFIDEPMIAHTIRAADETGLFEHIHVSTDCAEIAKIAEEYGFAPQFLRADFSDHEATVSQATTWVAEKLVQNGIVDLDTTIVQLMPNCPFRNSEDIENAVAAFARANEVSQISCSDFGWGNPQWAFSMAANNRPEFVQPHNLKKRSQDLPEYFQPSGAIWITKVKTLLEKKTFWHEETAMFKLPWLNAFDIDTPEDLKIALMLKSAIDD